MLVKCFAVALNDSTQLIHNNSQCRKYFRTSKAST